nr:immunoglobulin light chain junction region [Macaca mulatta]MOW62313.1 immunoglobulin light chain junction region [Macaca mulatta]MOW65174.1 immunoglobulin light chain junction region [Macaca mulatta]
CQQHSSYPYTF